VQSSPVESQLTTERIKSSTPTRSSSRASDRKRTRLRHLVTDLKEETREGKTPVKRIKFSRKFRISKPKDSTYSEGSKPRILRRKFLLNNRKEVLERRKQLQKFEHTDARIGEISQVENDLANDDANSNIEQEAVLQFNDESTIEDVRDASHEVISTSSSQLNIGNTLTASDSSEKEDVGKVEHIKIRPTINRRNFPPIIIRESAPIAPRPQFRNHRRNNQPAVITITEEPIVLSSSEPVQGAASQNVIAEKTPSLTGLTLRESIARSLSPNQLDKSNNEVTKSQSSVEKSPGRPRPTIYTSSDFIRGNREKSSPWPFGNAQFWTSSSNLNKPEAKPVENIAKENHFWRQTADGQFDINHEPLERSDEHKANNNEISFLSWRTQRSHPDDDSLLNQIPITTTD